MKGINASKIAAIAASSLLLASSAVAAGLVYENLELVNANGQPTAKVVVGSQAQISDGIAAANIAAVLANKAYKSSTLSATVSGQATCSATGGTTGGTGTCEVTDKTAVIEIVVPGQLANAYQFKTLITDSLDRTLANRVISNSEDEYTADLTASDTSTSVPLSPLRGVYSGSNTAKRLFRIGGEQFSGFKDQTVQDKESSFSYTVKQSLWIGSGDKKIRFSPTYDDIIASPNVVAYSLWFGNNDFGIPVCTKVSEDGHGNWAWCSSSSQYRTENHRLEIPFLGGKWVISKMTPPTTALSSPTQAITINGGSIKLAKEAKYDIIAPGGVIDAGDFKVRLADISSQTGTGNEYPAIIDILDSSDATIAQIKVAEGDTYTYYHAASGKTLNIHVYRTAPGLYATAKWAEIAIYSDEITLQDGKPYNLVSSSDKNYHFKVSLIWKNRDYNSGDTSTENKGPDSLREIVIYNEDLESQYKPGEVINFLADPAVFKLTYNGLDLSSGDYAKVMLTAVSDQQLPVSNASAGTQDCVNSADKLQYTGSFIKFKSDDSKFGSGSGTDILGLYQLNEFYVDPVGGAKTNSSGQVDPGVTVRFNGAQNISITPVNWSPQILYRPEGYTCYINASVTKVNSQPTSVISASSASTIRFEPAGTDSAAYGLFAFGNNIGGSYQITTNTTIIFQEDAGKQNTNSHTPVWIEIPIYLENSQFKFRNSTTTTSYVRYYSIYNNAWSSEEPKVYTERGSYVASYDTTEYPIYVAKRIGQPTFTLAYADTQLAEQGEIWEAKEGDTKTVGDGIKLKLKEIKETVGSCKLPTGSSTPSCTVDMSGVSAKIMPDNAATVEAVQPYDIKGSNLVIYDKEAAGVGGVQILVGGPLVNSATAEVLGNSVDFNTQSVFVKAIGNKIVVAGNTAADTMQAANEFIGKLSGQ